METIDLRLKGGTTGKLIGFYCQIRVDIVDGYWRGTYSLNLTKDGCYGHGGGSPSKWDQPCKTKLDAILLVCRQILNNGNLDDRHCVYNGERKQRDELFRSIKEYMNNVMQTKPIQLSLFD